MINEYLYAMTGDFGYYRALLPYYLLKHGDYRRCGAYRKECGFVLRGMNHIDKKVVDTDTSFRANKNKCPILTP